MSTNQVGNSWASDSNAPANDGASSIAAHGYRNYDGPLLNHRLRWWKITLALIRANVNKNRLAFWVPVGIIVLTYLIRTVFFYINQPLRATLINQGMPLPPDWDNPYAASLCNSMSEGFICLIVFVAAIVVGASSIAADNRANALLVYLSKPITRFDYLFGKWMGIFLLLYALILVPSLLMLLFFIAAYSSDGFLHGNAILIVKVFIASAIPAVIHSSLIVGFSAWSKSTRVTGAAYAAFYLILNTVVLKIGNDLYSHDKKGTQTTQASMLLHGSVFGIQAALAQHVYSVPPPQVFNTLAGGMRVRREVKREQKRRKAGEDAPNLSGQPGAGGTGGGVPPQPFWERAKPIDTPPLWFVLLLGGVYVVVPLTAAAVKVRAVEVIRG